MDEFFFSANCLHEFFFFDVKTLHDFFFDSTSFNVKEMQSLAQFNYSTAEGDSLFGVLIFAKFEYRGYRERNELFLKVSHLIPLETFFHLSTGNSASSYWSVLFFTVERKG